MSFFKRFIGESSPAPVKSEKTDAEPQGQLLEIFDKIRSNPKIYSEIVKQLTERNPVKFKSARETERYLISVLNDSDALGAAKLIDQTLGSGTFRTLSFLDNKQDSAKSVYKLLKHNIESISFEKQVEKGHYLNLLETYGVNWDLEKVSRDSVQNFFDANGQTLDGVDIQTAIEEKADSKTGYQIKVGKVRIQAPQDYDWRELIHFGGTTKQDSETSVGGFGEGLKIAAFVLLKDHGAKQVKAASRDWELDYYFDSVASEAYRKPVKGLHAKKYTRENRPGNYLEIYFEGDDVDDKIKIFEQARELFYSSENVDFQEASYNNKETGGFKILPINNSSPYWDKHSKGNLYLAGQRTHFDSRDKWGTIDDLNIWTWKKVQRKDRDRGMITRSEMRSDVLPMIVDSMSVEDLKKSVYDFKELWPEFTVFSISESLLEKIVEKLEENKVKLEFGKEYIASNLPQGAGWIAEALKNQGFKLCPHFMMKIGMKGAVEQFKDWQSHNRVEATSKEGGRIGILQKASKMLGLPEDELKEVWIFSAKGENSAGKFRQKTSRSCCKFIQYHNGSIGSRCADRDSTVTV
jgi:hypothetical protein